MPYEAFLRERDATVAAMRRLVGDSVFPGAAGWGPHARLVGRAAGRYERRETDGFAAVLDSPDAYRRVQRSSGTVPVFITGRLEGAPGEERMHLAFALNGRIAAVGRSFAADEGQRFSAMVPETALREGENDVEVLAIEPGRRGPVLVGGG
jgi:hypothetical protein